ncbi:MAG: hypothetical protein LWX01_12205 [Deltaproteobacteria bacterium]|nr:hypothetical protein [Deltaproteobacteria bacterium]
MPFTTNRQKLGPIEVLQDNNHFLVHIHPENRDRAKKIAGRQWDGERKVWVYPKDLLTYNALVAEFQKDADTFDIRRPKTKRPAGIKPPAKEADGEESDEQLLEELRSLRDFSEGQGKIHGELRQIRDMLDSINDSASNQNRSLEELRENQDETARTLKRIKFPKKETIKTEKVEVLPESLDLDKRKEMLLIEQALLTVAYAISRKSESFRKWMELHHPLENPTEFVHTTHEKLKEQLEKIVCGKANLGMKFGELVYKVQQENLIYSNPDDPDKVIPILRNLNILRNRFAHARGVFHRYEKWARSILYLMNLALVWQKIMMETEDGHE